MGLARRFDMPPRLVLRHADRSEMPFSPRLECLKTDCDVDEQSS